MNAKENTQHQHDESSQCCFPDKIQSLETFKCRFNAFKLPAEDCNVLFATYPAGSDIEPHQHDTANWGVVTHGLMYLTIDGEELTLKPGDWYSVPEDVVHSARCNIYTEMIEFWFKEN